jgi:hypothetical protein
MGKVIFDISMSLDDFIAAANVCANPEAAVMVCPCHSWFKII